MIWLPYVILRELYLQSIRDYVTNNCPTKNWIACHEGGGVIPNISGC